MGVMKWWKCKYIMHDNGITWYVLQCIIVNITSYSTKLKLTVNNSDTIIKHFFTSFDTTIDFT